MRTLEIAKEQFILSLHVRAVCSGPGGTLDSRLIGVSLGPYPMTGLDSIDRDRAAWSSELISTQHLAISLDTALEKTFAANRLTDSSLHRDYFTFVRCLRNAFAHNPYEPKWELRDEKYRRRLHLEESWDLDLTDCNGKDVDPQQYRYASGLLRLVDRGIALLDTGK